MIWIIVVLGFLANFCQGSNVLNRNKIIIDTDSGGDDAVAILLALAVSEKVDVLAITCIYGNTWLQNVEKNVLKTLTIAARSDVPVYGGANKPLYENFTATDYFGADGLSDFKFDRHIDGSVDRSKHAALAMIDLVKQYPGQVSILTLGPLTNVALAASLDPNFSQNVKRFYAMGSTPSRMGFNFVLDPESNAIFLKMQTATTRLFTSSDVTSKCAIPKSWRMKVLGKNKSDRIEFANNAESALLQKETMWRLADMITVATFIWPELVINSTTVQMSSITCNEKRGGVKFENDGVDNVELVTEFDVEGLKTKLLQYFV